MEKEPMEAARLPYRQGILLALVLFVATAASVQAQIVAVVGEREVSARELLPNKSLAKAQRKKLSKVDYQRWLGRQSASKLQEIVLGQLLERFATEEGIEVTDVDINRFIKGSNRIERQEAKETQRLFQAIDSALKAGKYKGKVRTRKKKQRSALARMIEADKEALRFAQEYPEEQRRIKRNIGRQFARRWKINKALHNRYGGRVIFQQTGPEPLDAYRRYLEEQQKKGSFSVKEEELEKSFWRYFTDDKMHLFLPESDGRRAIESPWWLSAATSQS